MTKVFFLSMTLFSGVGFSTEASRFRCEVTHSSGLNAVEKGSLIEVDFSEPAKTGTRFVHPNGNIYHIILCGPFERVPSVEPDGMRIMSDHSLHMATFDLLEDRVVGGQRLIWYTWMHHNGNLGEPRRLKKALLTCKQISE